MIKVLCDDCGRNIKKGFEIKISMIDDVKNISKRLQVNYFCLSCFKKGGIGSYFDERVNLEELLKRM